MPETVTSMMTPVCCMWQELFSQFGDVVSTTVYDKQCRADGTPVPKYGFVTFRKSEDCVKALQARVSPAGWSSPPHCCLSLVSLWDAKVRVWFPFCVSFQLVFALGKIAGEELDCLFLHLYVSPLTSTRAEHRTVSFFPLIHCLSFMPLPNSPQPIHFSLYWYSIPCLPLSCMSVCPFLWCLGHFPPP